MLSRLSRKEQAILESATTICYQPFVDRFSPAYLRPLSLRNLPALSEEARQIRRLTERRMIAEHAQRQAKLRHMLKIQHGKLCDLAARIRESQRARQDDGEELSAAPPSPLEAPAPVAPAAAVEDNGNGASPASS